MTYKANWMLMMIIMIENRIFRSPLTTLHNHLLVARENRFKIQFQHFQVGKFKTSQNGISALKNFLFERKTFNFNN